jgi:hypothetical protein
MNLTLWIMNDLLKEDQGAKASRHKSCFFIVKFGLICREILLEQG